MIRLDRLTKRFGAQLAVDALSFEVPAGQILGFLGPNGAGKTTTLRMLTGMIEPTDGQASVCGFDLRTQAIEVKRRVGFVPESGAVFESLTGLEYLEMVAALYGLPRASALPRIEQFLAFFELGMDTHAPVTGGHTEAGFPARRSDIGEVVVATVDDAVATDVDVVVAVRRDDHPAVARPHEHVHRLRVAVVARVERRAGGFVRVGALVQIGQEIGVRLVPVTGAAVDLDARRADLADVRRVR